jgi:hypothetical protein
MGTLNITSMGLLIGGMGQLFFCSHNLPRFPIWIFLALLFVPWFTVFSISFCKGPPCGPRPFRRFLIFAMISYLAACVFVEGLNFFIRPPPGGHLSIIAIRIVIYFFGAASFTVLIRACRVLRAIEKKPRA